MPVSKSRRWKDGTVKKLAWFHRWLGVATCLVFALWFASGAVLLFKPFPSLSRADQMALQLQVDPRAVTVSPSRAVATAGGEAVALRLVERGGTPAYIVDTGNSLVAVDARTGAALPLLPAGRAQAITAGIVGASSSVGAPFAYDQWVVHNHFDPLRPFYRIDVGDGPGTQIYASARTGEFVQRTNFADRAWNWVGAVLHWAYFTPLRSSFTAWDRTVWILSFVAMLVAIAGTILGVIRTMAAQRQRKPSLSFYRLKWMRWHHILGLFASLFVLTWILSGWLSMDHGRLFSRGQATPAQLAAYHGRPLGAALANLDVTTVGTLPPSPEIAFDVVGGKLIIIVFSRTGAVALYDRNGVAVTSGELVELAKRGVGAAWPQMQVVRAATVPSTDVYALAEGWPASAVQINLAGGDAPSVTIDGSDGRLLTVMSNSRAAYAWIYYALHTFNFPGLTTRPMLRDVLVMIPLIFGFLFSITGVVIGVQRLRKSL
ncbi:PepSY domain-containing protein [Sphingomonas sp. GB1N7]|uniref:PepSY domain-containing protein n=1 Tax=Parasphingomonas caseinilytica TaxID=3096158 RepID=UPI002FC63670